MQSLARVASRVGTLLRSQEGSLARTAQQTRGFAAGGHGHHDSVTHAGLTIHKAAKWHVYTGQAFAGLMWFWVFYRFYHDFDTFVYGHAAHLDHELHEEEHGSHDDKH
ncbi:NADH dehydrogenase [ubiquinone] 1 beta subcomplex subunit 2-like [Chlorella sorokiniana]|uniref:NADH dehydrogenase [ubiquinone] 1 beta subcomplex subunit 2-like n=1 Tax=Chlorella sorokiniana TaxID=3076 RepID=A0A2P6TIB2_CHLSO|nr:NADH dehydrogenase [ubiquinone] 1 beta subcomplex subunit 2-like [Chlorella sorokiniana]|eukprot:PRW34033.1 NADH dehydrogenase [ubiquinone] 1 beta subcomplex subunit 2-like [Chlorella sorokiniana]